MNRNNYGIPNNAIITVAGTVGVGKSTMTNYLAEALNFRTSFEKVDTNPYLDKFYADFERWSFHLQIYFLAERFKEQKRMFEYGGGFIQDRSIYEDTGIFAKMHYEKGTMSPVDYETYTSLFEAMVMTPYFPHPDILIYLEGSLEDILARIKERGRPMEQQTSKFSACPILRLNINEYDLVSNPSDIDQVLEKVGHTLKQTI